MIKVGIIGGGVVGSALQAAYTTVCNGNVRVFDLNPDRRNAYLTEALESDLVFICLPTPEKEDDLGLDTFHIEQFFTILTKEEWENHDANFVLKSTVPIGTTDRLIKEFKIPHLIYSPEFLTARQSIEDAKNPNRLVIGYHENGQPLTNSHPSFQTVMRLEALYEQAHPNARVHLMQNDEAEAVKLFQNAFSAIKISAFNEFHSLSEAKKLNWDRVRRALLAGGWINPMHTRVPGPDGEYGYGGTCLPKDLAGLIGQLREEKLAYPISLASWIRNNKVDRKKGKPEQQEEF